ncbi:MAG TPA: hypothetical protein VJU61_08945, partial [Polyangiaceae bacterium]|nr:hypothetical protein [Polyangiaceae bacterium]
MSANTAATVASPGGTRPADISAPGDAAEGDAAEGDAAEGDAAEEGKALEDREASFCKSPPIRSFGGAACRSSRCACS